MINFSIKTPKKQLHKSFQMVKFLAYCYNELVSIQAHCSLNCKKKIIIILTPLSLFSVLSPFSLLSPDGCDLTMVLVRRWFWFDNGGPIVMGPMWSYGPLWFDGLPLFSLLFLYSLFFVSLCGSAWIEGVVGWGVGFRFRAWIEAWVWLFMGRSVGLTVRGSSSAVFHSFNRRFLSLSSLLWSLPPCWIQRRWFDLLFLLPYSVFSLILLFVWSPRKWRERKIKIGNWDINVLIFGFNYNGVRSICVLFHIQSFLESLFYCQENGGKENI